MSGSPRKRPDIGEQPAPAGSPLQPRQININEGHSGSSARGALGTVAEDLGKFTITAVSHFPERHPNDRQ